MTSSKIIVRLFLGSGLPLLLLILILNVLAAAAQSGPGLKAASSDLTVSVSAPETVVSGKTVTYTITITNHSSAETATNILLIDNPPANTQGSNVRCDDCTQTTTTINIPFGQGYPGGEITITQQIVWPTFSLPPGQVTEFIVTVDVPCKPEGIIFNQAFINYTQGGASGSGISNEAETEVLLPLRASGKPGLADEPSWCADEIRAVFDLDWGDYDRDGDLDMALASTAGAVVYENEAGQLTRSWLTETYTLGVHWADIITANDSLELVTIGDRAGGSAPPAPFLNGFNYIYELSGEQFTITDRFDSVWQLAQVVSGDFDRDGAIDLVVTTNFPDEHDDDTNDCFVFLYRNTGNDIDAPGQCISDRGSTSLNVGDFNNDDYLDLALGQFDETTGSAGVIINDNGVLDQANFMPVDAQDLTSTPSEMIGGDYDRDGYLDIAEALPRGNKKNRVRILRNEAGLSFTEVQTITTLRGPFAIDWADFDGDGYLDLVVEDVPPAVYRYSGNPFQPFTLLKKQSLANVTRIRRMRAADEDNDGDIDWAMTDLFEPSQLFENVGVFLEPALTPVDTFNASSVAWGDTTGDGYAELLFGAASSELGSRLYENETGSFSAPPLASFTGSGFGPHSIAFGDADDDGRQDIAIGALGPTQLYLSGNIGSPDWRAASSQINHSVAWADVNLDNEGRLDLLVGREGPNALYLDPGLLTPSSRPIWQSDESEDTRSVAWGYYDDDIFPDFAAGNMGRPTRVYRNLDGVSFESVWLSPIPDNNTRSVAWCDFDNDGDMDLAVGNDGQPNYIYENSDGGLSSNPVWTSLTFEGLPAANRTTSLAWGDWNNDGKIDLAVGNYGQKDQVYANISTSGAPNFILAWESAESYQTTGVAWGDADHDGDLDLAISQDGGGPNGFYENNYVLAGHRPDSPFTAKMLLPHNPSYLSVARPGDTANAYFYASAEVFSLTAPLDPPTATLDIPIHFRVHDPDGTRDTSINDAPGDPIAGVEYHFSLDGGGTWRPATAKSVNYTNQTSRLGRSGVFTWDAGLDLKSSADAVSDNARFRITVIHENRTGPVQRAKTTAVSPPFRIRKLECVWPDEPIIQILPSVEGGAAMRFLGNVLQGQGVLTYTWDFGDGQVVEHNVGQLIDHAYAEPGMYEVTLRVTGEPCPVTREIVTTIPVMLDGLYLPLIMKNGSGGVTPTAQETTGPAPDKPLTRLVTHPAAPGRVTGFQGAVQAAEKGIVLTWETNHPADAVLGYRLYRSKLGDATFQLAAVIPPDRTGYTDQGPACGRIYFVTAYNAAGESLASTTSYAGPPCP